MILEEIIGDAKFSITRDNKSVALNAGDSFTDEEYTTRTIYGNNGKVVVRVDPNCTIVLGAQPNTAPEPVVAPKATPKATPKPAANETLVE